jgi:hypothetical protein
MTTHELANILLQQEDVPVVYRSLELDYNDEYYYADSPVNEVHLFKGMAYLVSGNFVSPEEDERLREEERRRMEKEMEEERRLEQERQAKILTWGKLLALTSKETQDAFLLFRKDEWDRKRYESNEIDPNRLSYLLSLHFASNARLSKEHMLELVNAATTLGLEIKQELLDHLDHYASMTRYNTDNEQWAAMRAARNNNK